MKLVPQFMGFLKAAASILWIGLCVLGLVHGLRSLEQLEARANVVADAAVTNLADIDSLLDEIIDVMEEADQSLGTIEEATIDAGISLGDTRPMIDETSKVVVQDIPEALDDVQETMPSVIEAAALVDDTLVLLSKFRFEIPNPFGDAFVISLGVDYNPAIPLDVALQSLSHQLDGIPEDMRGMENDLNNAKVNMTVISDDLLDVASDLDSIREQMADINPQIEVLSSNLTTGQESILEAQNRIPSIVEAVRKWLIVAAILFIVSQIPSLYLGWALAQNGGSHLGEAQTPKEKTERK